MNQLQPQGTLNRVRAGVVIPLFPYLNVIASFLGADGVSLSFEGETTLMAPTLTGYVTSPNPNQLALIKIHLLRTQNLASLYKQQIETSTLIGDVQVYPDSTSLPQYNITNCAIAEVNELPFAGRDPGFMVTIRGTYNINALLYTGA